MPYLESKSNEKPNRLVVLDTFRGLAILSVLLFHYTFRWGPKQGEVTLYDHSIDWFSHGWLGVEFFFIISGFVILMTAEKSPTVINFAISRFSRLYPTFLFCMTCSFLAGLMLAPDVLRGTLTEYLVGFTMQSPHFGVDWIDGAYWSLLIELKFYFWIAILYFGLRRWFVSAWVLFCVIGSGFSVVSWSISELFMINQFTPFFSIGMAYYLRYRDGRISNESIALYGVAAISYATFWARMFDSATFSATGLVVIMVLLFESFLRDRLRILKNPVLIYVGLISYPLYLLHQNIGVALIGAFNLLDVLKGFPAVVLATVAIFCITALVHRYIENPSRRYVREFLEQLVARSAAAKVTIRNSA